MQIAGVAILAGPPGCGTARESAPSHTSDLEGRVMVLAQLRQQDRRGSRAGAPAPWPIS